MLCKEVAQIFVVKDLHQMPVVQSGPLNRPVGNVESQRPHQMQAAACGGAGAGDIAAVLGDLRLHQHNIQHRYVPLFV